MKRIIAVLFFLLAATAAIFLILYPQLKEAKQKPRVENFEDCAKAGYPVMESYPRQCTALGGRILWKYWLKRKNLKTVYPHFFGLPHRQAGGRQKMRIWDYFYEL